MSRLEIKQLDYVMNNKQLIENLNATFHAGSLSVILGNNGSGKSTLLKAISGIWKPTHGSIQWNQQDLQNLSCKERSKTISLVPQFTSQSVDFTVLEMVKMGCYAHSYDKDDELMIIEHALKAVDAWHLKERLLNQLSGGERQRVYIARSLATGSPIILLDEPTTHLDLKHQLEVWQLLQTLALQGKAIITTTHDIWMVGKYAHHVLVINEGKKIAEGSFETTMTPELIRDIFGVHPLNFLHH